MRKFFLIVVATLSLASFGMAATAQACPTTGCGYPSIDKAEAFAVQNNVHGWCGHAATWVCGNFSGNDGVAICTDKRGLHSLDCFQVYWSEESFTLSYRQCTFASVYTQSDGVWIRYETSTGKLSFHWDGHPTDCGYHL